MTGNKGRRAACAMGVSVVLRHISLAGRIAVQVDQAVLDERALPGRQARLAFAVLVTERHRLVSHEELAENLWPDRRPDTWETALRGTVSKVRGFVVASGLGTRELLHSVSRAYRLGPLADVEVDIERAVADAEAAAMALAADDPVMATRLARRARAVLTRPLLAGIDGPWLEDKRRELFLTLLQTLELLSEARARVGDLGGAVAAAEAAVAADPFRESAHRLLMRALLEGGNSAAGLLAYGRCRVLLGDELGVDPSPQTQAVHLELLRSAPGPISTPPTPLPDATAIAAPDTPPYLGLQTFEERDAPWFFGRSADVTRLLDRLAGTRLLAVLGASGSGKSSLVRAGLVPALRRGAIPGSDTWAVLVLRPGVDPMGALADGLLELDPRLAHDETVSRLGADDGALHDLVEAALRDRPGTDRVLVVVDQLEELFTLCRDAETRRRFLAMLATAATAREGRTIVLVTLRADFYQHLPAHPSFADLASSNQFLVTPMDEVGLAEAIEGPARAAGLVTDPGLTQTVLRDVARRPGALPLLGHALLELWEHRRDGRLTLESYLATGGVEGAVAHRAEQVYGGLSSEEQAVARRVLLRLTQPGEGTADTRRRTSLTELIRHPSDRTAVERVVDLLIGARLLTSGGPPDREPHVEVSHESLITGWPRLRHWIEEDRAGLLIHRRLTEAATEWERLGRDEGTLYRGAPLAEAAAWAEREPEAANSLERAFLGASRRAQQAERRGRVRRLRLTAAGLGLGLLVAGALTVLALGQATRLADEVRLATARELAAAAVANLDVDPERSILLALEAVGVTREVDGTVVREAEEALHRAVKSSRAVHTAPQGGYGIGVAADGSRFVTVGSEPDDNTATMWDAETGEELLAFTGPDVGRPALALSPDDRLVATTHNDGTVRLWDAASGGQLRILRGHEGPVTYPAFSADGLLLVTGDLDGTVRIWDVATGAETLRLALNGVPLRPAFSHDGSRLVVAHGRRVGIWDLGTGELVRTLEDQPWDVPQAVFSPDDTQIATVGEDGTARLWNVATGESVRTLTTPAPLGAVAYDRDGTRLATAGSDGVARVWDVESGRELFSLLGHTGPGVIDVAFTRDGRRLFSSGLDDTTRLWDVGVAGAREWLTVASATGIFAGVAFSPDGASFAAPAEPAGVTVWDAATGDVVATLGTDTVKLTTVAFSPDGRALAAASDLAPEPLVWDVATGELRATLEGHPQPPRTVAFSPDGATLVTGSVDGSVRLWDADTGEGRAVLRPGDAVHSVAFSRDGRRVIAGEGSGEVTVWDARTLARQRTLEGHAAAVAGLAVGPGARLVTASEDGTARVWDLDSGAEQLVFRGHDVLLNRVALHPDGSSVATASDDGTTRLWDPVTGRELLTLRGHDQLVYGVDFSPDGRLLATASPDGTVALHLLRLDELIELARERVTRSLTEEECHRYLQRPTCDLAARP
jgi:WD40 repeat protein/DNA-binding SARP family transcriptional activator